MRSTTTRRRCTVTCRVPWPRSREPRTNMGSPLKLSALLKPITKDTGGCFLMNFIGDKYLRGGQSSKTTNFAIVSVTDIRNCLAHKQQQEPKPVLKAHSQGYGFWCLICDIYLGSSAVRKASFAVWSVNPLTGGLPLVAIWCTSAGHEASSFWDRIDVVISATLESPKYTQILTS